jgi:hypothetical protein
MKSPELFPHDAAQSAIDTETQKQLAGLEPQTTQPLIPEEFSLNKQNRDETDTLDNIAVGESTGAKKPIHKIVFTIVATGAGLGIVAGIAFGIFPRTVADKPSQPNEQENSTPQIVQDDSAELRSQLAFQDQKRVVDAGQPEPPKLTPRVTNSPTASKPVSSPAPRSVPVRVPTPTNSEPTADPFERWAALANLGKQEATVEQPTTTAATVATNPTVPSPFQTVQLGTPSPTLVANQMSAAAPAVDVPLDLEATENTLTPGALGILQNAGVSVPETLPLDDRSLNAPILTASTYPDQSLVSTVEVSLGTTIPARVMTPLVWDTNGGEDSNTQNSRFKVELTEAMRTRDGIVALAKGTQLIVQATAVNKDNQLVSASAIAVLYRSRDGDFRQETIPPGAILIQGRQGEPLVAQRLHDLGGEIAGQDLLVGGLSALGRAGALLNEPTEEFSNSISSNSFSSNTIRRSRRPSLLPALIDGFFNTTAERINQRSEQATQDLIRRNTIVVVPADTEVSVVINSFFRINR